MNTKYKRLGALLAGAALLAIGLSDPVAAAYYSTLPTLPSPPTTATVPMDTNYTNGQQPQTGKATLTAINAAGMSQAGSGGWRNALVGGDFGMNLWQRGTPVSSITNTATYTADRWAGWAGASGSLTVTKETAAADITAGYAASARVQRASSNTDTTQVCVAQALTSANSTRFQGALAEVSFHALAGANFSAAGSVINAYLVYGTGADQSIASLLAGTWTGQTTINSTAATDAVTISTAWDRYSVTGTVPVTATQLAVEVCFTPVGTAGTNDWFEFTGAQLDVNAGAVAKMSSTPIAGQFSIASVERRPASEEAALQYAYFYRFAEPASGAGVTGICQATGANTNACNLNMPVVMRATTPTIAITTAGTFKVNIAGTSTTIATPTAGTCSSAACTITAANTNTNGQAELLSGGGGTGKWDVSAEL